MSYGVRRFHLLLTRLLCVCICYVFPLLVCWGQGALSCTERNEWMPHWSVVERRSEGAVSEMVPIEHDNPLPRNDRWLSLTGTIISERVSFILDLKNHIFNESWKDKGHWSFRYSSVVAVKSSAWFCQTDNFSFYSVQESRFYKCCSSEIPETIAFFDGLSDLDFPQPRNSKVDIPRSNMYTEGSPVIREDPKYFLCPLAGNVRIRLGKRDIKHFAYVMFQVDQ